MLKDFGFWVSLAVLIWCCYHIIVAGVEREQDNRTTTGLYVAVIMLFFFGITGINTMFG